MIDKHADKGVKVILLGNKSDLLDDNLKARAGGISAQDGQALADKYKIPYL